MVIRWKMRKRGRCLGHTNLSFSSLHVILENVLFYRTIYNNIFTTAIIFMPCFLCFQILKIELSVFV